MLNRRQFNHAVPIALAAAGGLAGCSRGAGESAYQSAVQQTWRLGPLQGLQGAALGTELLRCATLAPSSHNTQCWKFALEKDAVTILPDLSRRCPAVDPDDHHLFVSLGCAAENLIQAARAHGLRGEADFNETRSAVRITLSPVAPEATGLFNAIASRQSTRAEYDGKPIASDDLNRLQAAAKSDRALLLLLSAGFSLGMSEGPANPKMFSALMFRSNMNPSKLEWAVLFLNSRNLVRRGQMVLLISVPAN
jgi:hypothetical protein